jgi:hypothetical protein
MKIRQAKAIGSRQPPPAPTLRAPVYFCICETKPFKFLGVSPLSVRGVQNQKHHAHVLFRQVRAMFWLINKLNKKTPLNKSTKQNIEFL